MIYLTDIVLEGTGGTGPDNSIDQENPPKISKVDGQSILVEIQTTGMQNKDNIVSYKVFYQRMVNKKTSAASQQVSTSPNNPVLISNLTQNALYKITTQAISSSGEGNKISVFYKLLAETEILSKQSAQKEVGEIKDAKSYLKITGGSTVDDNYTLAYRTFESIQLPTSTNQTVGEGNKARPGKKYGKGYYAFGTSILMPSLISGYEAQGAGLGFFVNPEKGSGYYIGIETTSTSANSGNSPIKIFKLESNRITKLEDSQKGNVKTLDRVFGGTTYNVDVRVKIEDYTINIIVHVNGFKITAEDKTSTGSQKANDILEPTKIVGLVGISGTSMFDYVYAESIDANKYNDTASLNFYKGQFTKDYLDIAYGDLIYKAVNEDTSSDIQNKKDSFDEFGTVVREIARKKVKFPSRPSIPISFTTGSNNLAQLLSQTFNRFEGEAFVLNNTSVTIPLADGEKNALTVLGYTIGFSGDIEYETDPVSEYSSKEPVIFESQWLHNEDDVKKIADWIRSRVVNKTRIIEMEIFGNPLISVGDIISVDDSYQGFTPEEKIIVVKVSHSFKEGITTKIVGRTI